MTSQVLVVTNESDAHADVVCAKLAERGKAPLRLNFEAFPRDFTVAFVGDDAAGIGRLRHTPSGRELTLGDIGAVWVRKKGEFGFRSPDMPAQERRFAIAEAEHTLFSCLFSLNAFWMSHPLALRAAGWKGEQLLRARRMGFETPTTLLTNEAEGFRVFRNEIAGDVIFKAQSSAFLAVNEVELEDRIAGHLGTTKLPSDLDQAIEALEELPSLFQAYVDKDHELRVIVVGDRVFAAKIHSQDDPRTLTDYRNFPVTDIRFEATALPPEVETRCVAFVRSYGLTYGALDLICTPDGRYVFLENNPGGQFLFVESLIPEYDISGAIADQLLQGLAA